MSTDSVNTPILKDLTVENITENVKTINSQGDDSRMKYLFERLVQHLHDYARETRLSTGEWEAAIRFLTKTGQICTDVRQEFILLSDVLGLSLLVDAINHPKPPHTTESTVLGPFHSHEAQLKSNGDTISSDPEGEPCLVISTIRDTSGRPVEGVKVDVWETDSKGFYDVQYIDREGPDQRAVLRSDKEGTVWFKAIVPVPYPIPHDGPVGKLLLRLKRHWYRPSHLHFMFEKKGYDHLITALYLRGDPYESSDAVFGVKESLVVDLTAVTKEQAEKYAVKEGSKLLAYDFVLVEDDEARKLRDQNALTALAGMKLKLLNGLPVPDID